MENMVSKWPCVIKDRIGGSYLPKGWIWSKRDAMWVTDLKKAKVYRNSAGAKNALRGVFNKFYKGPEIDIEIIEFHEEYAKQYILPIGEGS